MEIATVDKHELTSPPFCQTKTAIQNDNSRRSCNFLLYSLFIVFAISSWIDINGVWSELPFMIQHLPESWDLASYLVIIIQIANIGPLTYALLAKFFPKTVKEWPVIYLIIGVGLLSTILLYHYWNKTGEVAGKERSLYLFIFCSLLSLVDCTSSVVYLPYMAYFDRKYMSAFYIGEGFSGLIPSVVGLAQGTGGDPECKNVSSIVGNETVNSTIYYMQEVSKKPEFSVSYFMLFLGGMIFLSGISFTIIHFVFLKRSEVKYQKNFEDQEQKKIQVPFLTVLIYMAVTFVANAFTNGIIPASQTYSCAPYGYRAYNLSNRLSMAANPLMCFFAFFVSVRNPFVIIGITLTGTACCIYHLIVASMSPSVPLMNEASGEIIIIITSIFITGSLSYVKVCTATALLESGRNYLLLLGIITQVGSLCGAVSTFVTINVYKKLVQVYYC